MESGNLIDPNGFVWLWRKSIGTRAFKNPELWKVWTWCLMKANHKEKWVPFRTGKSILEINVQPGQFIFGRKTASKELDMPESSVRNRMAKLKKMENIDIKEDSQYSIISIINWISYQANEEEEDSQKDRQRTGKGHKQ